MTDHGRDDRAHDGLEIGEVVIGRAWNLRGDPRNEAFVEATARVLGVALPRAPMTSTYAEGGALLWLGPRSWLHVGPEWATPQHLDSACRAMSAAGGALFDVSASYVGWRVSGATAARALNRACPLDFHPRVFGPGQSAQSLLGHVVALFHRPRDEPSFVVLVARSFAADAFHVLREAMQGDGYRTVAPTAFAMGPSP